MSIRWFSSTISGFDLKLHHYYTWHVKLRAVVSLTWCLQLDGQITQVLSDIQMAQTKLIQLRYCLHVCDCNVSPTYMYTAMMHSRYSAHTVHVVGTVSLFLQLM